MGARAAKKRIIGWPNSKFFLNYLNLMEIESCGVEKACWNSQSTKLFSQHRKIILALEICWSTHKNTLLSVIIISSWWISNFHFSRDLPTTFRGWVCELGVCVCGAPANQYTRTSRPSGTQCAKTIAASHAAGAIWHTIHETPESWLTPTCNQFNGGVHLGEIASISQRAVVSTGGAWPGATAGLKVAGTTCEQIEVDGQAK